MRSKDVLNALRDSKANTNITCLDVSEKEAKIEKLSGLIRHDGETNTITFSKDNNLSQDSQLNIEELVSILDDCEDSVIHIDKAPILKLIISTEEVCFLYDSTVWENAVEAFLKRCERW